MTDNPVILPSEAVLPEDAPDRDIPGYGLSIVQELGTCDDKLFPDALLIGNGEVLMQYNRVALRWVYCHDKERWVAVTD